MKSGIGRGVAGSSGIGGGVNRGFAGQSAANMMQQTRSQPFTEATGMNDITGATMAEQNKCKFNSFMSNVPISYFRTRFKNCTGKNYEVGVKN